MDQEQSGSKRLQTLLRALKSAYPIAGIGLLVLVFTMFDLPSNADTYLDPITQELGAALFVAAVLVVAWDLGTKRAFYKEVRQEAGVSESVIAADVERVSADDFGRELGWPKMLDKTKTLTLFVSWGNSWRDSNWKQLTALANRKGSKITILLPDPEKQDVVKQLARMFPPNTEEKVRENINHSRREYERMFKKCRRSASHKIYFVDAPMVYTFYLMDSQAVFSLYKFRPEKQPAPPSFVVGDDGHLFRFISSEAESVLTPTSKPVSRQVYPTQSTQT